MDDKKRDIQRQVPSEERRNNDPNIRDESAPQPGVNTISNSDYDEANEDLTKTASDGFVEEDWKQNADPSFDDIHDKDQ